ncbi:MAG: hypothetical protein LQ344_006569 [Seirophora lacunosa]|nr:MAG: hypothetical protein LQ344_006569 [Seirophora lacunosa]
MVNQIGGRKRKTCRTKIQQLQQGDLRMSAELAQYLASWVNPAEFFRRMSTQFGTTMLQVALRDSAGYDVKLSPDLDDDLRQLTSRFFSSILDPLLSSEDGDVDRSIGIFSKFRAKNEGACDEQRGPRSIGHDSAIAHVSTQWARELNTRDIENGIQHLQQIGLAQKAYEANAHSILQRIHSSLLRQLQGEVMTHNQGFVATQADQSVMTTSRSSTTDHRHQDNRDTDSPPVRPDKTGRPEQDHQVPSRLPSIHDIIDPEIMSLEMPCRDDGLRSSSTRTLYR